MATILTDLSRTFSEYLLIPRLTKLSNNKANISLSSPICRFNKGEQPRLNLNIPVVSSSMQAVSGEKLAIALAREGGISFIPCSQDITTQIDIIKAVKNHKAGFVFSGINTKPETTLRDLLEQMNETGHSTVPVTEDGTATGKLLGIITDNDFWQYEDNLDDTVINYMTPIDKVIYGEEGISLKDANQLLRQNKKECLPIIDSNGHLVSLVFKKDYVDHQQYPLEMIDDKKQLIVGAGVNTHDYKERIPLLVEAGVDVLCFDSSDGFSEYQKDAIKWVKQQYGDEIVVGGGNVVSAEAFTYLAEEAQADFIKVGIGGGSICITREQKGIGRGQASAVMDVAKARDEYFEKTGTYIPICSDGGLANDTQIIIALAMGADFVMMGRYFAMTHESPTPRISIKGRMYKPYWGEGSNRARNWQRYSDSKQSKLAFEEGVDAYVPLIGRLSEVLKITLEKMRSTMINLGSNTLQEFRDSAVITLISEQSVAEGGTSTVQQVQRDSQLHYED